MTGTIWHPDTKMSDRRRPPRALAEFARRRTWGELLYALVGLFQGIFGFVFTVVTLVVGVALSVTFVGLPLIAASGLVSRWLGDGTRRGANLLLGTQVAAPPRFRPRPGLFGWLGSCLGDATAWRARFYLLLKFPVGIVTFVVAAAFWAYGLTSLTYPIWRPFTTCNTASNGTCHRGYAIGRHYADHPLGIVVTCLVGFGLLLAAPWVVRGILRLDRTLVRALLGPTARAARVEQLEQSRAAAVDDSAATLRRIERDLHDGAQARLVALAMNVGLAREKLAEGGDPVEASRLLDSAHSSAKQAIAEVRDLARGIHPPVLDSGLDTALATLAAHSPIPVRLDGSVTARPDPAIETMLYFCAAELLTNAAKHSGAHTITVETRSTADAVSLAVTDDGRGGARIREQGGLSGLVERVSTVDGQLRVDSPDGGPTSVRIDVPRTASRPSAMS